MRIGVSILALFGMVWGLGALLSAGAEGVVLALPPLIAMPLIFAAWKSLPPATPERMSRMRRTVRFWSMVEAIAIIAAVLGLQRMGLHSFIPSAFAIIVGLHFLPLARSFPQPLFYVTGAAMLVAGAISAALKPMQLQAEVALSAGAFILWASAIGLILVERKQLQQGTSITGPKAG